MARRVAVIDVEVIARDKLIGAWLDDGRLDLHSVEDGFEVGFVGTDNKGFGIDLLGVGEHGEAIVVHQAIGEVGDDGFDAFDRFATGWKRIGGDGVMKAFLASVGLFGHLNAVHVEHDFNVLVACIGTEDGIEGDFAIFDFVLEVGDGVVLLIIGAVKPLDVRENVRLAILIGRKIAEVSLSFAIKRLGQSDGIGKGGLVFAWLA